MKKSANKAGSKLSSYEPGQIVRGLDFSAYRVTSKVAGPEGAVVKLANLQGEPVSPPADFTPVGLRMAHLASAMFFHLAYNKDFDLYVRAYCERAGLPIPVGPDGKPFKWADWLQSTISPKLIVPGQSGEDAQTVKDEAIHEMLFTELGHRNILGKFKAAIKNFPKDIRKLPEANQLTVYLVKNFRGRVEEMNRKIKGVNPEDEVSMLQNGDEDEEFNILETEDHATQPSEYEKAEAEHDITKFRNGFYEWLKKHQSEKSAKWFITLFDIYWNWINESSENVDEEGRPSYMPARRHLEPEWAERTGLSNASLYDYIGRLAKLLELYIKESRTSLGEDNAFVRLLDGIVRQREQLKKKKKPKQKAMPAHASLDSLRLADFVQEELENEKSASEDQGMKPLTGGSPAMSLKQLHDKMAAWKIAKLVRGDELTPEMEQQVKDAFIYRWTSDNPNRTRVYHCDKCDLNEPYVNAESAEGHSHPTIPLQTDEQWIHDHAFYFTNDGRLMHKHSAEPIFLAPGGGQAKLPLQASKTAEFAENLLPADLPEDEEWEKAERDHLYCPECKECVTCNLRPCRNGGPHKPGVPLANKWGAADTFDCCGGFKPKHKEGCPVYEKNFTETMDRLKSLPKKNAELAGDELVGAAGNILEARADQMLTSEDWRLLAEALMVSGVGQVYEDHGVQHGPKSIVHSARGLLEAAKNLVEAKKNQMVTSEEWEALAQAYKDATGQFINWRTHDEDMNKEATEPLQQLRPDITPGDTGRLPHATKEGGLAEKMWECRNCPVWGTTEDSANEHSVNRNHGIRMLKDAAGPVTPQQMQTQNVQKSQGMEPPQPSPAEQSVQTDNPMFAIAPDSGVGEDVPMKKTIPPELPNQNFHMGGYMTDQQMMQEFFRPRTEREVEQDYRDQQPVSEATKMRRGLGEPAVKRHEGSEEKTAMLKTEENTPEMEQEVEQLIAAHPATEVHQGCTPVFEHGQWWVTCGPCGAIFSVVDAEGGHSINGLDLEEIESGDESCMESFTASADKTAGDDAIFADKKKFFDSVKRKHRVK